jgi:site-specific recombinase XerD
MTALAPHLAAFLRDHLQRQRGASAHTCDSYAGSFRALLTFASTRLHTAPSALTLEQLDADLVGAFLEQLETTRHNGAATRNVRLAAIRAFFRFLQHREPAALEQIRRILAIPFKRQETRLVPYLTATEVQALVDAPAPDTRSGIRDRAMLHLTICAGLRVSELTELRLDDVAAQATSIRAHGKGRRERALPLWKATAVALRAWLTIRGPAPTPEVFVNARGQPFSRWGIAHVLRGHGSTARRTCASLARKRLSPHVLRHTSAMIVLQATHDIRKVSLWLGHSHLTTTEMYVRADPSEKLEAIEAIVPPHLRKGAFRPTDALLAWLKNPR